MNRRPFEGNNEERFCLVHEDQELVNNATNGMMVCPKCIENRLRDWNGKGGHPQVMTPTEFHNDLTMRKAHEAIKRELPNHDDQLATDIVNSLLNAGILFRERS